MTTTLVRQSISRGENVDRYMAEVNRHPLLSRDEEFALARAYYEDADIDAAHKLVVANLRFVVKIAHEYRGYGLKLLDLIQEGNVGLMTAVKKFDPYKGYRLISYAVWWVRACIQSFIMRSWSLVRLGGRRIQRKLFFKLRSERLAAERDAGNEPVSRADLAARLDIDEADIADMEVRLAARDFSLDAKLNDNVKVTHLDMLPDSVQDAETTLGELQEQHEVRTRVDNAMATLNEKERYIVEKRLLADEPSTLQEIGDNFKISRERIRQLESRVMSKLRASFGAAPATP